MLEQEGAIRSDPGEKPVIGVTGVFCLWFMSLSDEGQFIRPFHSLSSQLSY